ncbi:MAG: Asp-tRNA(Asn)/Glu-tRNA(Gln) amidotransferase subunit GatC [bacterium]
MIKKEILRIAALARIDIDEPKLDKFTEAFSNILKYFEKLNEVPTENVSPFELKEENVYREDEVSKFEDRDKILKNAPERSGDFFKVRKIIG